jgi:hypothetical protein
LAGIVICDGLPVDEEDEAMATRPERDSARKRTSTLADMARISTTSHPATSRPLPPANGGLPPLGGPLEEAPAAQPPIADEQHPTSMVPAPSRPSVPARLIRDPFPDQLPVVVPPTPSRGLQVVPSRAVARGDSRPTVFHRVRPVLFLALVASIAVVFGVNAHFTSVPTGGGGTGTSVNANGQLIPPPSGQGPWDASVASVIVVPPPPPKPKVRTEAPVFAIQPCQASYKFLPTISQWAVPPGCYSYIYKPNPANYVSRPGFGYCNWWVRVTHPNHPDITENTSYPRGTKPMAGAPIFFDGGEQGAESIGHWAVAVAIAPDNYWVLISEMNFAWRGAGFGRIDYRYVHVSPHVHFVYILN